MYIFCNVIMHVFTNESRFDTVEAPLSPVCGHRKCLGGMEWKSGCAEPSRSENVGEVLNFHWYRKHI